MNFIWNHNLEQLKIRFPSLFELYKKEINNFSASSFPFYELVTAKNASTSAIENKLRLHSVYNPEKEAASALANNEIIEKSTGVFMGFGLGYHAIEWAKLYPYKKLVLIEPDLNHFLAALYLLDWSLVFKIPNLVLAIACPLESVLQLIEDNSRINVGMDGVSDSYIFSIPSFTSHNQSYFDSVKTIFERNLKKNEINAATYEKFSKRWIRNSEKNLKELKNCDSIQPYKGLLEGKNVPFLLVAAGPSLTELLPHLNEIKKHAIIICVETALHAMLNVKVEPDFIILTDPQYWAYKHISNLSAKSSILITELSVYPSVFKFACKKILLSSSTFPIGNFYENYFYPFGDLGAGGSVASSAWNFAYFCGAKEIFLCGLDLSYPKKETHIKGSSAEEGFHKLSNRIINAEKLSCSMQFTGNPQTALDYKGNKVLTDSRMLMFAWWFESRIAACPDSKTYSICEKSLKIPGIELRKIKDICNNYSEDEVSSVRNLIHKTFSNKGIASQQKFSEISLKYKKEVLFLQNCVNNAIVACKNNDREELENIEKKIKESQLSQIVYLAYPSKKYFEKRMEISYFKEKFDSGKVFFAKKQIFYEKMMNDLKNYCNM